MTPSCWSTESVFSSTQSSAILPSAKRKKLIPWISMPVPGRRDAEHLGGVRPAGAPAGRDPVAVARDVLDGQVEVGHPGAEDAEKALHRLEAADRLGARSGGT